MNYIKVPLLLFLGSVLGWYAKNVTMAPSSNVSLETICASDAEVAVENSHKQLFRSIQNPDKNDKTYTVSEHSVIAVNADSDALIQKLLNNRAIAPLDLALLNHWLSFYDFIDYVSSLNLTPGELYLLRAKAEVFFNSNYSSALEELYSAQNTELDERKLRAIKGQIKGLITYVNDTYFSPNSKISQTKFLEFMYLVFEKNPHDLLVLTALIKHHLFLREYSLVKSYIDSIPPDPKNVNIIKLYREKLTRAVNSLEGMKEGIPLKKHGNHFLVPVSINDEIVLNLLLDTGASKTVVSRETMGAMMRMSYGIKDLQIEGYASTANGMARISLFQANVLEVGGFKLREPIILTSNIAEVGGANGLLGMDFLGRFQFRIDHEKNLLYLSY